MLNLYPTSKANIVDSLDPVVGPLCRVRAFEVHEDKVTED
jgi:hypothetical protein